MGDKSLGLFLMVLFGISGIAILILAWLWPMPVSDRVMTTFLGSTGFLVAVNRAVFLKSLRGRTDAGQLAVKVEVEDKP